jgi:hypothetical protein
MRENLNYTILNRETGTQIHETASLSYALCLAKYHDEALVVKGPHQVHWKTGLSYDQQCDAIADAKSLWPLIRAGWKEKTAETLWYPPSVQDISTDMDSID